MTKTPISPFYAIHSLWMHRRLILDMAKRDALGKYKGSSLGVLWSLLTPIFMLAIYTFVFSEIFQARWTATSSSKSEFAIVLFAGMIMFNLFAENVNRAPGLIIGNVNFVKKIVFPLEVLACVNLMSAMFHMVISILVLLVFQFVITGYIPLTLLLLPLIVLPLALICLGISWFLSAIGVFLRDVGQTIGILVTGLMFLSPVFFPLSAIPARWQVFAKLNPMVFPIEMARRVIVWGKLPDWQELAQYTAAALLVAWAGFICFQKTRRGFADVL
ncbi:ABC transporter permease [Undibacterium sp. Jales W-56]|uniref:ABC transporter permease n=1 Tax=Undibacterium sp. Jales W-56 TaxID=2897325 RepID=UPI0021D1722C|nr:ABC transporter permease [Undibacterium sp. Jales W-56]MCU6434915.1 ABC transporter permease [Undibacterium sp. Jales W-56]